MNSDVKALLSLLLLQHGATSREILTTLRLAATTREQDDEQTELEQTVEPGIPPRPVVAHRPEIRSAEIPPSTPKQRLRNDHLAPIARTTRAA